MLTECRHILPRGTKCRSVALRGKLYCYFHHRLQLFHDDGQRYDKEPLLLPSLEDRRGIQTALTQVLSAFGSGRIDSRKTGLYLYGLQLATQLAPPLPEPAPEEMVHTLTVSEDATYIAAEEVPFLPPTEAAAVTGNESDQPLLTEPQPDVESVQLVPVKPALPSHVSMETGAPVPLQLRTGDEIQKSPPPATGTEGRGDVGTYICAADEARRTTAGPSFSSAADLSG